MAAHCNLQVAAAFKANRCLRDCVLASLASRCNEGVERKCRRPEATSQAFSVCVHRPGHRPVFALHPLPASFFWRHLVRPVMSFELLSLAEDLLQPAFSSCLFSCFARLCRSCRSVQALGLLYHMCRFAAHSTAQHLYSQWA